MKNQSCLTSFVFFKRSISNLTKESLEKKASKHIITPNFLNTELRNKIFGAPTTAQLTNSYHFFNKTDIKLEWSSPKFEDIPGEKHRLRKEEELNTKFSEDNENDDDCYNPVHEKSQIPGNNEDLNSKQKYEKTGVPWNLLKPLPEVLFLGKCNVGKSTLINALVTPNNELDNRKYSRASKRAGFTQTLNCFNFGNILRIIDSPGYGVKGRADQGEQIMDYLQKRKQLARVFLLIAAKHGFSEQDRAIMEVIVSAGVPFEIVFTKTDRLIKQEKTQTRILDFMRSIIEKENLNGLPMIPQLIFCNAETSNTMKERYGMSNLRYAILEACGYSDRVQPKKKKASQNV